MSRNGPRSECMLDSILAGSKNITLMLKSFGIIPKLLPMLDHGMIAYSLACRVNLRYPSLDSVQFDREMD